MNSSPKSPPSEEEFCHTLTQLDEILIVAAGGAIPEDAGTFREIPELLTGERIEIEQMGENEPHCGWLRARFRLRLLETCSSRLGRSFQANEVTPREIVIDIRDETIAEKHVQAVTELYDGGMLVTAIANKLGIERHQVTDAIKISRERNGEPPPEDGRVRRALVPNKLLSTPVFQAIAEEVKQLLDQDLLVEEIAERVGRNRDTVRASLRFWYETHGQIMPDLRHRRKTLSIKNRPKPQNG